MSISYIKENIHVIVWNKENSEEVTFAREKFNEYLRRGWLAFIVTSEGKKVHILDFNQELEKIYVIAIPQGG
ncbi:MAG: hypothetical protein QXE38_03700 [Candidatus Methanomethylicia archaeon]